MYLINDVTTVTWELDKTLTAVIEADFGIFIELPNGSTSFLTALTTFVAPTANTKGVITYDFTPVDLGVHRLHLVKGTEAVHTVVYQSYLYVIGPLDLNIRRLILPVPEPTFPTNQPATVTGPASFQGWPIKGAVGWAMVAYFGATQGIRFSEDGVNWYLTNFDLPTYGGSLDTTSLSYDTTNSRWIVRHSNRYYFQSTNGIDWTILGSDPFVGPLTEPFGLGNGRESLWVPFLNKYVLIGEKGWAYTTDWFNWTTILPSEVASFRTIDHVAMASDRIVLMYYHGGFSEVRKFEITDDTSLNSTVHTAMPGGQTFTACNSYYNFAKSELLVVTDRMDIYRSSAANTWEYKANINVGANDNNPGAVYYDSITSLYYVYDSVAGVVKSDPVWNGAYATTVTGDNSWMGRVLKFYPSNKSGLNPPVSEIPFEFDYGDLVNDGRVELIPLSVSPGTAITIRAIPGQVTGDALLGLTQNFIQNNPWTLTIELFDAWWSDLVASDANISDYQRNALVSDQNEFNGFNGVMQGNASITRISDTVIEMTFSAQPGFSITIPEIVSVGIGIQATSLSNTPMQETVNSALASFTISL